MFQVCSIIKACLSHTEEEKMYATSLCCKGEPFIFHNFYILSPPWEKKQIFIPTPWFILVACIVTKYLLSLQTHRTLVSASF